MRKPGSIQALFFIAGFLLLQSLLLPAQHMIITLDKEVITLDEAATVRLSGEANDISALAELPVPEGLIISASEGESHMNSSGGKIKFDQVFRIKPYHAGTFTIGPAWVKSGSNRIFSNKITLIVKNSNREAPDIGMLCIPDKKKAYVGEQVILSLCVFSLGAIEKGVDRPVSRPFKGFWYNEGVYPIAYPNSTIRDYTMTTVYQEYVFPNSTGVLQVPPYAYECIFYSTPVQTNDAWTDNVMAMAIPQHLESKEVPIEVIPLPEKNKPADFSGDVGVFSMTATLDRDNARVNEMVKLTIVISGNGNINLLGVPKIQFPDGIKSYSPVSKVKSAITNDGLEGDKTFTISFIPEKQGDYTIPGISFSYFDPEKKEYVTTQTTEFKLHVEPGAVSADVSENNLPPSFLDDSSTWKIIKRVLWICIPAILLILVFNYNARKKRKEKELAEVQKEVVDVSQFPVDAAKKKPDISSMLHTAEQLIANGRIQSGIAQLYETLLSAVLFKTELGREEASIHQLRYRLGIKKLAPEIVEETLRVLEELGAQRYNSQEADRSKLSENLEKTRKLALALIS